MKFENPRSITHESASEVLEAVLRGAKPAEDPNSVLIALALHDDDRLFVEEWCRRIGSNANDPGLRGTAALAIGHIARRFRQVDPETKAMLQGLADDPAVDGRKYDALSDVLQFTPE